MSNGAKPAVSRTKDRGPSPLDVAAGAVEAALVRRTLKGDSDSFGELVRRYQRRAVSVAYRLLGNVEDAGDVAQDAFVRTFRSLGQLEDPTRFGPWLLRTVSNLALNFRRARATRSAATLDDAMTAPEKLRDPTGERTLTVRLAEGEDSLPRELHAAILAAMDELPDKQRLALVLFSVEGLPQKEVAEILDCSVELVKWNVFQARQKLKEILAEYL